MLSSTASSYTNSVNNSDSGSLRDSSYNQTFGPKTHRKKLLSSQQPAQLRNHVPNSNINKLIQQPKSSRKIPKRQEIHTKMQEVAIINKRHTNKYESSDISSNNFTCSELDSLSNLSNSNQQQRLFRKKLIKCVLREDIDTLKSLVIHQKLLNVRDKHRNTLMHIACGFGRLKSAQALMKACPLLIDELDDKGHNPIDVAIKHGQIDIIKWILPKTNRLELDTQTECMPLNRRSCLHLAAKHGENEILKFVLGEMLKHQLALDTQDSNGNTAAHLASKYNHLNCLQTLVEYNCDVTITNKNGHTPCFVAEFYGNQECVHYLMIVETCINLSIKVVKMSRRLRETKTNNEILKAQMDEAIAINNDFIKQRESVMNISLDLMQRQLDQLESKILNEIEELKLENKNLLQQLKSAARLNQLRQEQEKEEQEVREEIEEEEHVRYDRLNNHDYMASSDASGSGSGCSSGVRINFVFENDLNLCKQELNNTKLICNKVLNMDERKLESVKTRFNEIKQTIEANSDGVNSKSNFSSCDSFEIIENKEHFDVLRKMYQETTHKLMVFRNALKERQMSSKRDNQIIKSNLFYSNGPQELSNSSSSSNSNLDAVNQRASNCDHQPQGLNNNKVILKSNSLSSSNENGEHFYSNSNSNKDYQISIANSNENSSTRQISSTPNSFNNNNNNSSISNTNNNNSQNINNQNHAYSNDFTHGAYVVGEGGVVNEMVNENFDYSSDDETLSDNEYVLDADDDEDDENVDRNNGLNYERVGIDKENVNRNVSELNFKLKFPSEDARRNGQKVNYQSYIDYCHTEDPDPRSNQFINEKTNSKWVNEVENINEQSEQFDQFFSQNQEQHNFHKQLNDEIIIEELDEEEVIENKEEVEEINENYIYNCRLENNCSNKNQNKQHKINHQQIIKTSNAKKNKNFNLKNSNSTIGKNIFIDQF